MTDKEKEIMRLMYDLQVELHQYQSHQIAGLKQATEGLAKAIDSVEKSHEILGKLMKATSELIGVQ